MTNCITALKSDGYTVWTDGFGGTTLGSEWTAIGTAPGVIDDAYATVEYNSTVGAYRTAVTDLDTTNTYTVELLITPYQAEFGGDYIIYSHADNTTPDFTDEGFVTTLSLTAAGAYSGSSKRYTGGALTNTYTFSTGSSTLEPGWLTLTITTSGTANIKVKWQGTQILNQNITVPASGGQRIGMGMNCTVDGSRCLVDMFKTAYYVDTDPTPVTRRQIVCAASNGVVYYDAAGTMTARTGNLTVADDRYLDSAERAQALYIADYGEKIASGTNGTNTTTSFDSATYADWTTVGIDTDDHVLVITSGTGVTADVYEISSVAAGSLALSTSPGTSGTGINFYISRCPKVFTASTNTLTRLIGTDAGSPAPTTCPLVCLYRDRLVFAGAEDAPHVAYASRISAPTDYSYGDSSDDPARAWYLGASSQEGTVGHPITALIPVSDDLLVFGCSDKIMILRGDVTYQGQMDVVSHNYGILGPRARAWCYGPAGEVFAIGKTGLFMMPPTMNAVIPMSDEVLPRELKNIDTNSNTVLMNYDLEAGGIHIFVTPNAGGQTPEHWFFTYSNGKGFWPVTLPTNHEAFSIYGPDPVNGTTIWGSRNGYLRNYNPTSETDEGTAIDSYIYYGPIRTSGNDYRDGFITEVFGVLASGSGDVTWELYVADACEGAVDATTAFDTATWSGDGLTFKSRPRARAGAFTVKVKKGSDTRAWSLDRLNAVVMPAGIQRKF
jgi:hypothetical protein